MEALVIKLTTSGNRELNQSQMKELKNKIKINTKDSLDCLIPFLLIQLRKKHGEIRLSTCQIINELFIRFSIFRQEILQHFEEISECFFEKNLSPKYAQILLFNYAVKAISNWSDQFGKQYPKIKNGLNYLQNVKKINFIDSKDIQTKETSVSYIIRQNNVWKERVQRVEEEMQNTQKDLENNVNSINQLLDLLIPFYEENPHPSEEFEDFRAHGLLTHVSITVSLAPQIQKLSITEDNRILIENLKEEIKILKHKHLPLAIKWTVILTKATSTVSPKILSVANQWKNDLERLEQKLSQLQIPRLNIRKNGEEGEDEDEDDDEDDDDDFEDVPEPEKINVIKWSCRAPLGSRLCPRRDAYKCPLHGPIIPRNEFGEPACATRGTPDWQNPGLLRHLKETTGLDLKVGKRKKSKKPLNGLRSLSKKTVRQRLLQKIRFKGSPMPQ